MTQPLNGLFNQPITAINLGLARFGESLQAQKVSALLVDWKPPLVERLTHTSTSVAIDDANNQALERILAGHPMLVGVGLAKDVIPNMTDTLLLHAGPPITWERMCGPMRGAIQGALVYEGLAATPEEAESLVLNREIQLAPCNHHHTVGPMAGVVTPSMPVWIVENQAFGNRAYCTFNEGLGRVLRYGAYGDDVYQRLHWLADTLFPALRDALALHGTLDLRSVIAQALHMGDECHNRNRAATSLFLRTLAPALVKTCHDTEKLAQVFEFIDGNDHFFLNLAMAAAKSTMMPAENITGSTIATTMARNGTDFGIQVSGAPDQWFIAPAGVIKGLYLPGFKAEDANLDIGDSTITETAGFGAFAMAGAPAIASFIGGTAQDAMQTTLDMYEICHTEHRHFSIPTLDFRGTPVGLDVRLIMETGILPRLNTGIAHKQAGIGMVGAGVLEAPQASFEKAYEHILTW
jgi:hypothetical protein